MYITFTWHANAVNISGELWGICAAPEFFNLDHIFFQAEKKTEPDGTVAVINYILMA